MTGRPQTLDGATVALLTPLDEQGNIDAAALGKLIDRVIAGGVTGISPTGSTGEGARLSRAQRLAVTGLVRQHVAPEVPVISGVPLANIAEGVGELEQLAAAGASAALVAPPHYYPLDDADAVRLYVGLADRAPLPVVLYNIPIFTKITFAPKVVAELAGHPNIAGIKDSSRDIEYFKQVTAATRDLEFSVVTGSDTFLVACLLSGGVGTIAASANLVPHLSSGVYRAVREGDLPRAVALEEELGRIIRLCRGGTPPAAWKAALAHLGVCQPYLAAPASPFPETARQVLGRDLAAAGITG